MKKLLLIIFLTAFNSTIKAQEKEKEEINTILNNWHKAAAEANYNDYMNILADDAVYIGTDAIENWTKKQFEAFAKPYFDKRKTWNFTAIERHIYFSEDKKTAWFDELLNTQMKICRGSGIMVKKNNSWKIKHYVLSMTIPNNNTDAVTKIKASIEDALIDTLKKGSNSK